MSPDLPFCRFSALALGFPRNLGRTVSEPLLEPSLPLETLHSRHFLAFQISHTPLATRASYPFLFFFLLLPGSVQTHRCLPTPLTLTTRSARGLARPADVLAVLDGAVARTPHAVALAVVTIIAAVIAGLGLL